MALSRWLCTNNTSSMVVKIVYPGGRVELHDRPMLASEIMMMNPRCCVTHPDVFRQPWDVVSPDTVLMLGQKFYVVPVTTLWKLRQRSSGNPNSPRSDLPSPSLTSSTQLLAVGRSRTSRMDAPCPLFGCLGPSEEEPDVPSSGSNAGFVKDVEGEEHHVNEGCFKSLLTRAKPQPGQATEDGMSGGGMDDSCDLGDLKGDKERSRRVMTGSSKRRMKKNSSPGTPAYRWQPDLESISEE